VKRSRLVLSLGALATIVAAALAIPWPHRITAAVTLQPAGATHVYVTTPGVLTSAVPARAEVAPGAALAQLQNRDLELARAALVARRDRQRLHVAHLKLRQHDVPTLGAQIPAAAAALADLNEQLAELQSQLRELDVTAPVAGTVLAPRRVANAGDQDELTSYAGTPLEAENLGCYLETGTLLCTLGNPRRLEAVALIDEAAAALVRPGQVVRLQFAQAPETILTGEVERVARGSSREIPPEVVAAEFVPVEQRPGQAVRPLGVYYEATIRLDAFETPLLAKAPGEAKIRVAAQPLGTRLYRSLRHTLRWPW
jgi:putative peptide zinc metalloprotease protein